MYRRDSVTAAVLLLVAMLAPAIASSAWRPLPGFDEPAITTLSNPCWHHGELYLAGRSIEWTDDGGPGRSQVALFVLRDGAWLAVRDLPDGSTVMLHSDGGELVAMSPQRLHRWRGERWVDVDAPLPGEAAAMVLWQGRVVAGGDIGARGTKERPGLVTWNGHDWEPLGGGVGGVPMPRVRVVVKYVDALWVAGRFERAGDLPAGNVARWDGATWDNLRGGANGEVVSLTIHDGGVVAAGTFTEIGGVACGGLAMWRDGSWHPLPAPVATTPGSGESCPLPIVVTVASAREGLLALGDFRFTDPDGESVAGAAVLEDGQWRRWRHDRVLSLTWRDAVSGVLPRRRISRISGIAGDGDSLVIAGRDLAAQFGERVTWRLYPRLGPSGTERLVAWGDELLLLRSEYIGPHRVGGLGRLVPGGWEPVGDWLGPDGEGGGAVQSAVEWQGRLVVAGVLESVAGRPTGHVAAFDGSGWQPLGGDGPTDSLTIAQLLPRRRDLVLLSARGWLETGRIGSRTMGRFWRWDGNAWSPIALPPLLARDSTEWRAIAAGDTIWVAADVSDTIAPHARARRTPAMLALVDTTWTIMGRDWESGPGDFVYWNGAPHGLVAEEGGQIKAFVRWDEGTWRRTSAPALPYDESMSGLLPLGEEGLLVGGRDRSWFRSGSANWAPWPACVSLRPALAGGRLYRLASGARQIGEYWDGDLPVATPELRPQLPSITPWRPQSEVPCPDLPPLAGCAPTDSRCGWYLLDPGGTGEPPLARAHDNGDIEITGCLIWQFTPEAQRWYRVSGRLRSRSGTGTSVSASIDVGKYHDVNHPRRNPDHARFQAVEFELLMPTSPTGARGRVAFRVDHGSLRLEDLRWEEGPRVLADALQRLLKQVASVLRPSGKAGGTGPTAVAPDLAEAAGRMFSTAAADSLALAMVADLGDDRLWIDGYVESHENVRVPESEQRKDHELQFSTPASSLSCERLPSGVDAWLDGELAYTSNAALSSLHPDGQGPHLGTLRARGLILDLRESSWLRAIEPEMVVHNLHELGAGATRWACERDGGGNRQAWWKVGGDKPRLGKAHRVSDIPIVVLVSSRTDRSRALLVEALSRLDNVTLIGETTAPLPAVDVAITVPWASWKLMVPSGTWEAPGGRVLTGTVVEPDIAWPAADTDGLVAQARAAVDAFVYKRSGHLPAQ